MDSKDYTRWWLELMGKPTEGERFDHGVGVIAATIANSAFGSKGERKIEDFIPKWGKAEPEKRPEPQTPNEHKRVFGMLAKALGHQG